MSHTARPVTPNAPTTPYAPISVLIDRRATYIVDAFVAAPPTDHATGSPGITGYRYRPTSAGVLGFVAVAGPGLSAGPRATTAQVHVRVAAGFGRAPPGPASSLRDVA
jgi:hypothetical protein